MSAIQAEASKPQKKMQECNRCKAAGFPNQPIAFEKIGEDPATGKIKWKLVDENGQEHVHKGAPANYSRRKRIMDIATVTDVAEARKLLALGWDYDTSYPATIANVPHYVLVKRE
jgi:hypothetical protein